MSSPRRLLGILMLAKLREEQGEYDSRNTLVVKAMGVAAELGYDVGIRLDPDEPEWPVVYIELPTGQISFHLPQHAKEWDGHDTEEKWRRVKGLQS